MRRQVSIWSVIRLVIKCRSVALRAEWDWDKWAGQRPVCSQVGRGPISCSLLVLVWTNEISSFRRMHSLREALLLVTSCIQTQLTCRGKVERCEFSREEKTRDENCKGFNGFCFRFRFHGRVYSNYIIFYIINDDERMHVLWWSFINVDQRSLFI